MIDPKDISAVIVTKGDRDLGPIFETLEPFGEVVVWNNSEEPQDEKVYGRYIAAGVRASSELIYVQDDDCLIDPLALLEQWADQEKVLCNMKPGHLAAAYYQWRIKLVGFGAFFNTDRIFKLEDYLDHYPNDDLFKIECDRVFTALNECETAVVPVEDLRYASDSDRLWKLPDHGDRMREIEKRLRNIVK